MSSQTRLSSTICAVALGLATAGTALGAPSDAGSGGHSRERVVAHVELNLVERPSERFRRSIETHRLTTRYGSLLKRAERLDVAPRRDLRKAREAPSTELRDAIPALEREIERAESASATPEFESVAGVSQATLEAIATCESGGDPGAVNPAGYYGKYQFDLGTWAGVGGSGNPAEASESEQDYRAALLLSRAGSSPWPVCGA